jgi:tetratricopeptide (TPR) repeat protein
VAAAALLVAAAGALAADPEVARLLERAQFWRDRARDDLAREELAKVFRLAPDDPQALAMLARVQVTASQDRDAAATLQRLRRAHPNDPAVAQLEMLLRFRGPDREALRRARQLTQAGRFDEAVEAYRQVFSRGFPDDDHELEYVRALAATRAGRDEGAAAIARLARKHPDDPRYQVALAVDQSARKPVSAATLKTLKELTGVPSVARQARDAWRRALLALDEVAESLPPLRDYLAENPGDTALQEKLEAVRRGAAAPRRAAVPDDPAARARREAVELMEAGRLGEADPLLQRAIALKPEDAESLGALGVLRMRQGRHGEALTLFRRARSADPGGNWARLERTALYWSLLQQSSAAREIGSLEVAQARAAEALALDPGEGNAKAELARVHFARARKARDEGRDDAAIASLREARLLDPDNPWVLHDLARLQAARGDVAGGEAAFRDLVQRNPADADARFAMALFLSSVDRDADAIAAVDAIPAHQRSDGMRRLAEELRRRIAARAEDAAKRERGETARSLADASRAAETQGDVDRAVALELESLAIEPSDEVWRKRRLAQLRDQQLAWTGVAFDGLHRSGTPGKSRLDAQELPFGYRDAWGPNGRAFFRVAPSRVASGALDLASAFEASTFGTLLLCRPACAAAPPEKSHSGVAFAAGSQIGDVRLDVGATPLGFPIVNIVGGAVLDGRVGELSYSIDASRRPMVSSLLSYAGARDPNTGRVWGGVVSDGVRLSLSHDKGEAFGVWGLAGLYRVTGENVKDNHKAEAMAGGYWRYVNEDDRQLAVGLNAMWWRFSENAGEYTFGHGGYYSPAKYVSLGLPVTYAGRSADTSYYLRASVSVSRSHSHRAPYFPTDASLQAQAEALASVGGVDPFYAGGDNGRSYGRSFAAAIEHRLRPDVFIGARLDIERSTNYTPNRLLLYVRMSPWGATQRPLAMPPEPVVLPGFQY